MTKQEEIREGVAERYYILHCKERGIEYKALMWRELPELQKVWFLHLAGEEMKGLHSQGVVIKVDRELPKVSTYCKLANVECIPKLTVQQDMLKAGYAAVEPLIEE